ncbi:MAG: hypothetical protein JXR96_28520 [Deltaproteobacteria bacterium]|nr:hypothetical protein [Deltaproteobacteria bacterium]
MRRWMLLLAVMSCGCVLACSGNGGSPDSGTHQDGQDVDGGGDEEAPVRTIHFDEAVVVEDELAGQQIALAATPDDQFAVAYFKQEPEPGTCENPILGGPPTPVRLDTIRYARFDGTVWSEPEDVVTIETAMLSGIDLVFDGETPLIAYLGGDEGRQICGGSDAMIARPDGNGGWTESAAVTMSDEAPELDACPKGQGMCDFGDVVGMWPSMAVAPDGTIGLAYRDVHNGYTKEADESSDLEWAFAPHGATSWSHQWIDIGRGSGLYNSLAFGPDGTAAVAYYNGKHGVLTVSVAGEDRWTEMPTCVPCTVRSDCPPGEDCIGGHCVGVACVEDTECEFGEACLEGNCTSPADCPAGLDCVPGTGWCWSLVAQPERSLPQQSASLAIAPDGRLLVAWFDPDSGTLRISHSADGLQWTHGSIDTSGRTGMYPNILVDPQTGRPGVAYYRCSDGQEECQRAQDGVRFAFFTGVYPDELSSRYMWVKVTVSEKGVGSDGLNLSAAVLPDGSVGIAYAYSFFDSGAGEGRQYVMFQKGTWSEE